ncbi:MAG: ribonuclease HII [bacterium]|nr:ribonuclease HII [bacterium]
MKKQVIAGIDEVGRGPLAGPVIAAAVVILQKHMVPKLSLGAPKLSLGRLRDSKKLSAKKREEYYDIFLKSKDIQWGIGKVFEKTIDKVNIYQATKLAMVRAVRNLSKKVTPEFLYIDGTMEINVPIAQKAVIRGDETIQLCAMASIVAKVTRDRLMANYHKKYPAYGFDRNKGYGTKLHLSMLKKHGPCKIHRKTFKPLKSEI